MIALSVAILVLGAVYAQREHYLFIQRKSEVDKIIRGSGEISSLKKEFDEYKKRVDSLTLKAGFKL